MLVSLLPSLSNVAIVDRTRRCDRRGETRDIFRQNKKTNLTSRLTSRLPSNLNRHSRYRCADVSSNVDKFDRKHHRKAEGTQGTSINTRDTRGRKSLGRLFAATATATATATGDEHRDRFGARFETRNANSRKLTMIGARRVSHLMPRSSIIQHVYRIGANESAEIAVSLSLSLSVSQPLCRCTLHESPYVNTHMERRVA